MINQNTKAPPICCEAGMRMVNAYRVGNGDNHLWFQCDTCGGVLLKDYQQLKPLE